MKEMVIYLSGPITGTADYIQRFADAADELRGKGFTVINPARNPKGLTPADYMRISLAQLEAADAILLLDGWAMSRGAVIEGLFAAYCGKTIFTGSRNPFSRHLEITPVGEDWMRDVVASGIVKQLRENNVEVRLT